MPTPVKDKTKDITKLFTRDAKEGEIGTTGTGIGGAIDPIASNTATIIDIEDTEGQDGDTSITGLETGTPWIDQPIIITQDPTITAEGALINSGNDDNDNGNNDNDNGNGGNDNGTPPATPKSKKDDPTDAEVLADSELEGKKKFPKKQGIADTTANFDLSNPFDKGRPAFEAPAKQNAGPTKEQLNNTVAMGLIGLIGGLAVGGATGEAGWGGTMDFGGPNGDLSFTADSPYGSMLLSTTGERQADTGKNIGDIVTGASKAIDAAGQIDMINTMADGMNAEARNLQDTVHNENLGAGAQGLSTTDGASGQVSQNAPGETAAEANKKADQIAENTRADAARLRADGTAEGNKMLGQSIGQATVGLGNTLLDGRGALDVLADAAKSTPEQIQPKVKMVTEDPFQGVDPGSAGQALADKMVGDLNINGADPLTSTIDAKPLGETQPTTLVKYNNTPTKQDQLKDQDAPGDNQQNTTPEVANSMRKPTLVDYSNTIREEEEKKRRAKMRQQNGG